VEPTKRVSDPAEPLVRYLFDGHIRKSDSSVKWQAFKPPADNKTSIYLTRDLQESAIWSLGTDVASERKQPLRGRADFTNGEVLETDVLTVELDPPPERHANIVGWPVENDGKVMSLAQHLAAAAKMVPVP
jgi:hypothetical protein